MAWGENRWEPGAEILHVGGGFEGEHSHIFKIILLQGTSELFEGGDFLVRVHVVCFANGLLLSARHLEFSYYTKRARVRTLLEPQCHVTGL
jgi:hypothetical protein